MARKQGVVETVEPKTTQAGQAYHRVKIDGVWYGLWKPLNFKQGQTIAFDELIKGDFKNMANVEVSTGAAQPGSSATGPVGGSRQPNDSERQTLIMRQNATTSAIALVAASKVAGKQDVDSLLELVRETAKRIFAMNVEGYEHGNVAAPEAKEVGADVLFQP